MDPPSPTPTQEHCPTCRSSGNVDVPALVAALEEAVVDLRDLLADLQLGFDLDE